MLRRTVPALILMMTIPAPAFAWGYAAHRFIMRRALDLLPLEVKPFFDVHRDEIVVRVTDPDLWRGVGWDEAPNHFIDFGVREYGAFPFAALPREYGAALEKFGTGTLRRNGLLPWRTQEMFGNLRRAFEGFNRGGEYGSTSDIVLLTGVASHYLQDAYQPLHATDNYDGRTTGQTGLHVRFERDLFVRVEARLTIHPAAPAPMVNARDAVFDAGLASHQLVAALLKADKDAIGANDTYDDAYYERFFAGVRPLLEERLSAAVTATAGLVIGAWEQAGRPAVRTPEARPVQKVRRP